MPSPDTAYQPLPAQTSSSPAFYSSLVVEHIVAKSKTAAFERWYNTLAQAAERQEGFVRFDKCPPLLCADDVTKWYTIVHFDSPEHLNAWIASEERQQILNLGQEIVRAYRFKSFTTGLEGWFSQQSASREKSGLGPPVWKQILSVVFGLYPIVMLRLKLFPMTGIIGTWSPAGEMLLTTLATSSILSIIVMPLVTRSMGFWLYPAYRRSAVKTDALGLVIILSGLIFMAAIFDRI